jgi:hypothetical protein
MKRFMLSLSLSVSICGSVLAQDPGKRDFLPPPPAAKTAAADEAKPTKAVALRKASITQRDEERSPSDLAQISMTPEIWIYLQELKRYDDPQQAVRRKAEQRAADRQARLAAMRWYGFSNARPQASACPWMGTYSPVWSGNSWDPYQYLGIGWPGTALRIEQYEIRR